MYSVRCSGASAPNTGRASPPAERTKSPRRPPAAQATPVGPNRQCPLPESRQPAQASRSRQRFRHAAAARQRSRPPRSPPAIGLSAAVGLEGGAAHINPSGPSREGPSTSPQPSITAGRRAFSLISPSLGVMLLIEVARCRLPSLGGVTGLGLEVAARPGCPSRCEPASGRRWPDPAWPGARRTAAWASLGCRPLCVVQANRPLRPVPSVLQGRRPLRARE